ncbi:energy transducer TonB [Hymenobacter latericus]|uniref:energy transducer TonB n=1 Tax=Hymenobacter sp. YIM 151858-1 TaxID=2987688 RepID=UPI002226B70E|nr:energy transducer TonB [Hymenobacter sp. YIM 151858-1]UYZ57839.1 TonB family protein [Hymenobacter sp. YIM 151858-1]
MKYLLSLGLISLSVTSYGQQTKKVTEHRGNTKEQYSALKTDPTVKHGPYARYEGQSGQLAERGYYRNGVRDSLWTEYHWGGSKVRARGAYRNNQKVGEWQAYDYQGELVQRFDYTTRQLLLDKPNPWAEKVTAKSLGAGATLDSKPTYIGGWDAVFRTIGMNIRYPAQALRNNIQGEVRVAFTVDADGKASGFRVAKGIGAGCDEESLRVIQMITDGWFPAQVAGQPVAAELEVPVSFSIR